MTDNTTSPTHHGGMPELNEFLLVFHFDTPLVLPENPVALLRGLLGRALAHWFYPDLPPNCPEERIPRDSLYWRLFKPEKWGCGRRPPYLLESAWGAGPAATLHARLRIFGGTPAHARIYAEALGAFPRPWLGEFGRRTSCAIEWMRLPPPAWPAFPAADAPQKALALTFSSPAQLTVKFDEPHGKLPLETLFFNPPPAAPSFLGRTAEPVPLLAYAAALSAAGALESLGAEFPALGGHALSRTLHAAAHDRSRFFRATLHHHESPDDRAAGRQPAAGIMGRLELLADPLLAWFLECGALLGVGSRISHGCGRLTVSPPA